MNPVTFPAWFVILVAVAMPFLLCGMYVFGASIYRQKVLMRSEALLFVLETMRQAGVPLSHDAMVQAVRELTDDLRITPDELAAFDRQKRK